ncbi:fatty acid elongation protein-like protein [Scheffersomyces xylosifermentans]|uniref:fatty acid elongation protein-like protein n=1 Tax=Scheffersomyces xylosifermentans TaxID=1304137 RepID=UPI00315D5FCB
MPSRLVKFGLPDASAWHLPTLDTPVPPSPFENEWLTKIFNASMNVTTPLTIAIVYFSSVHFINPIVKNRQLAKYRQKNPNEKSDEEPKRLAAAPYAIARSPLFKVFVLLHNIFLCVYSVWTFYGMTSSIFNTMDLFKGDILPSLYPTLYAENYTFKNFELFFQSICDSKQGIFSRILTSEGHHNLEIFGWWFYISKFYEVIDTIVILLKGRPSSLLQSYHHAGAMMCMWAGIRFQSPPIWIFVVFNSFIHSLMYFYFSLSCLHIRVPTLFKRALTSLQITQFVVGGSIAILHSFIWIIDTSEIVSGDNMKLISCISTPDQALPILINVAYLTPLTALFAAFYIESYLKRK